MLYAHVHVFPCTCIIIHKYMYIHVTDFDIAHDTHYIYTCSSILASFQAFRGRPGNEARIELHVYIMSMCEIHNVKSNVKTMC